MSSKIAKTVAASVMTLSLSALVAPIAAADPAVPASVSPSTTSTAANVDGSFGSATWCFPLGSVVWCI
ncbi:hypothetical protein [Nocardia stercoris]|uniref:hypothetical protein n=1 Tax=Nocardia stercoris TaxID=2483361 RepID=UPI0011C42A12|nr:hypothetical protein [Nocardia stercoris]